MYSLVGVDGNAYSVMGYTKRALQEVGLRELVPKMLEEAMSSDYDHLLATCIGYVDLANQKAEDDGQVKWATELI